MGSPALQAHVGQRLLEHRIALRRHAAGDRRDHAGMGAVSHHGNQRCRVDLDTAVERRAALGWQILPALERGFPCGTFGCARRLLEIRESGCVGRDHAGTCAGFDGHVADGHALVHRHGRDRRPAKLEHVTRAAGNADPADDGEDQVLGRHTGRKVVDHVDREGFRPALQQALRGEHMPDFGGANAEGEGAEGSMRGRVGIAANNGLAGLRDAELGPDDVHDAATAVLQVEQLHAELARILFELSDLLAAESTAMGTPPNTCSVRVGVE